MAGYVPANTYDDPAVPEYDPYGNPLPTHPRPRYGSSSSSVTSPYTPSTPWDAGSYRGFGDKEELLGGTQHNIRPTVGGGGGGVGGERGGDGGEGGGERGGLDHRGSTLYAPPADGNSLRHRFRKVKQFRRLFFRVIVRWLISCLFCGAVAGLLIYYAGKGVLDRQQKYMFNTLYVGISLMLALNIVASFKGMAGIFRWKILASATYGGHSAKELDLILGMPSYGTSVKLLWYWLRKPKYFFFTLFWVFLGVGAQVVLALLGLTFSHENDGAIRTSPGTVNASMLDAFYLTQEQPTGRPFFHQQNYLAHLYGDMSLFLGEQVEGGPMPIELDDSLVSILYQNATNSFKYYFKEYVYAIHGNTRISKTTRYVTASSKCKWSPITKGQQGNETTVEVTIDGKSEEHIWAENAGGMGTTVYVNPSINANETELALLGIGPSNYTCGSRCGIVLVYRFLDPGELELQPKPNGDYYRCETTISPVQGATVPAHDMSDSVAERSACSIGSSSVWTPYLEKDMAFQTSVYSSASRWDNWLGLNGTSATEVAEYIVSRFAIGSIATLDSLNPRVEIQGQRPWVGVFLQVKWMWVWVTIGSLLGGQIVVGMATIIAANSVFCKDSSFLSTARLLRPLVVRMGETGCAATGDEIAALFHNTHMRYGVRRGTDGTNHLDVLLDNPSYSSAAAYDSVSGAETKFKMFPKGYYE